MPVHTLETLGAPATGSHLNSVAGGLCRIQANASATANIFGAEHKVKGSAVSI